TVVSVDYVRNVGLHTLLGVDQNHLGDSRFLDMKGAQAAIATTLANCGAATIDASIQHCPGLHPFQPDPTMAGFCNVMGGCPANIGDYAGNGLTTGLLGGGGGFPSGPGTVAFPGINPNFGQILLLEPFGPSVYNAMQVSLKSNVHSPVSFIHNLNTTISYSLSRYKSPAQDGDFINTAVDQRDPLRFLGPNGLDRTHQLSA